MAEFRGGNVEAVCPQCGALTTFEYQQAGQQYGSLIQPARLVLNGRPYSRIVFQLLRCAGCGRAGLAGVAANDRVAEGILLEFLPLEIAHRALPDGVPPGIVAEFREAERCAAVGAWRAGSAMFRSALEKTLEENGYKTGSLMKRIDDAAGDGVITAARKKRAHEDVRVLGNDVLHEPWREVKPDEYAAARFYVHRIVEDFYDSRAEVEATLIDRGRIKK